MRMTARTLFALILLAFSYSVAAPGHAAETGAAPAVQTGTVAAQPRSNEDIRKWYNHQVSAIPALNKRWVKDGLSAEERARKAQDIRHDARVKARGFMANKDEVKLLQNRDLKHYGNPDGPTFDYLVEKNRKKGLQGDAVYEEIVTSSSRTDKAYNEKYGVRPPAQAP